MKSLHTLEPSVLLKPAEYNTTPEQEQRIERQLAAGRRGFVIGMAAWAVCLLVVGIAIIVGVK